jgi:hypothetical protein
MCMYSAIGDNFKDQFPHKWPNIQPEIFPVGVSQKEFDALKKEMEELKKLLKAAKLFDTATNQPHCEVEDKIKLIKQIAKLVGVDLKDLDDD